jgi:hypothetical protein
LPGTKVDFNTALDLADIELAAAPPGQLRPGTTSATDAPAAYRWHERSWWLNSR